VLRELNVMPPIKPPKKRVEQRKKKSESADVSRK
jgi:hypothetical protein